MIGFAEGNKVNLNWGLPSPLLHSLEFHEDFEAGTLPFGWLVYNTDGTNWTNSANSYSNFVAHSGLYCMTSASYLNGIGALNPDNWLITPPIAVTADSKLKFWVSAQDPNWSNEQYYIRISTTGNELVDFTETIHSAEATPEWSEVVLDLGVYAGETLHIAFVHTDCSDQYFFKIDDVTVTNTASRSAYTIPMAAIPSTSLPYREGARPLGAPALGSSEPVDISDNTNTSAAVLSGIKYMQATSARDKLFDNGPFINAPGQGTGGADVSHLHSGLNSFGHNVNLAADFLMADDFIVDETWAIESFTFYAYQTSSQTNSPFTGGFVQILDAAPDAGGQNVWGDLLTNRMASTAWTNSFRTNENNLTNTERPIMQIVCATPGLVLEPGTYWVVYGLTGIVNSGPWIVPVTITGQLNTGNAKQLIPDGWVDLVDGATNTPSGIAFIIEGKVVGSAGSTCENGELLGYNVYRDGVKIVETGPSVHTYLDRNLAPGTYTYGLSAVYGEPYPGESDIITCEVEVLPTGSPEIVVDPTQLTETLTQNNSSVQQLTLTNDSGDDLNFSLLINAKTQPQIAAGSINTTNALNNSYKAEGSTPMVLTKSQVQNHEPTPFNRSNNVIRYDDGVNFESVGINNGGRFEVSTYWPASTMAQYAGNMIDKVEIFISYLPEFTKIKIYDSGTSSTPGILLYEQIFNPIDNSWNMVELHYPVLITGEDIWIGYEVIHSAGKWPAGCDAGPAVQGYGDLILYNGVWSSVYVHNLDHNWNIAAHLVGGSSSIDGWLSATPLSGVIPAGESMLFDVTFDATGLDLGTYGGSLIFTSSGSINPMASIPVTLNVVDVMGGFDLVLSANPSEGGTVSGAGSYNSGDEVTVEAEANEGWEFLNWTNENDEIVSTDAVYLFDFPSQNLSLTANFAQLDYELTLQANPAEGGTVSGSGTYHFGEEVALSASAAEGYVFVSWTEGSEIVSTNSEFTFVMPSRAVSLSANFEQIIGFELLLFANPSEGGTVSGAGSYNSGDEVTVEAEANEGWEFLNWTNENDEIVSTDAVYLFDFPSQNLSLTANFAQLDYELTLQANPAEGGTVSGSGTYHFGEEVALSASAAEGYVFVSWTEGDEILSHEAEFTFTMPANHVSLSANFVENNQIISGRVSYYNQYHSKIPYTANLRIALYDNQTLVQGPKAVNHNGDYLFDEDITPGKEYSIRIWEESVVGNSWTWQNWRGVNATDALIISYMGSHDDALLNFPWIAPAAAGEQTNFALAIGDVNGNGSVNASDALVVMRRAVGLIDVFGVSNFKVAGGDVVYPEAPPVVFEPHGVYNASTPAGEFYHDANIIAVEGRTTFNIYYIASGDVNASYVPQEGAKTRQPLRYEQIIYAEVGEEIAIPVRIDRTAYLGAMSIGLSFDNDLLEVLNVDGFDVVSIDNNLGTFELAHYDVSGIQFSSGDVVFTVYAKLLMPANQTLDYFMLESHTEFVDRNSLVTEVGLTTVVLDSGLGFVEGDDSFELKAYPNPFTNETNIVYNLPENGLVQLVVYNSLGQEVVRLVEEIQEVGYHSLKLSEDMLVGGSVYFYKLKFEGSTKFINKSGSLIYLK